MYLTDKQVDEYNENGFIYPIDILSKLEIEDVKNEIDKIEKSWPDQIDAANRNNMHYYSPIFDNIAHNSKLLDSVESLIGKNILVAGSTLFMKEPDNKGFISWHQDGYYQGWEPYNYVTAWLAITEVTEENGCMWMWPKSHKENFKEHKDSVNENNLLTRGQTISNVPIDETVPIILKPGQLSIHHPLTVHSSGTNKSKKRRIGFAIQSYIPPYIKQLNGKTFVQLARGNDELNYHVHTNRPISFMDEIDLKSRDEANIELQKILYKGAKKIGKY